MSAFTLRRCYGPWVVVVEALSLFLALPLVVDVVGLFDVVVLCGCDVDDDVVCFGGFCFSVVVVSSMIVIDVGTMDDDVVVAAKVAVDSICKPSASGDVVC